MIPARLVCECHGHPNKNRKVQKCVQVRVRCVFLSVSPIFLNLNMDITNDTTGLKLRVTHVTICLYHRNVEFVLINSLRMRSAT